jgi:D-sedoheptulose 7-phosphate isomerase
MLELVQASIKAAAQAAAQLAADEAALKAIAKGGDLLVKSLQGGGRVYSCGNGGSMCDAMHFAEELSGKFRSERPPLAALAISDPAHLTCTGNDFGFDQVFARFVEAHGRPGDVLLAISTSGTSRNILAAVQAAKKAKVSVITLTGRRASPVGQVADIDICTPVETPWSDRIQELHIKVIHTLIELCEHGLFGREGAKKP